MAGSSGAAGAGNGGNGGDGDALCVASPGTLVWGKAAIEAASTVTPVDVVMGQTDDVVAAAVVGGSTFAQYRWDASGGTKYYNHDGPGGDFAGPLFTSGLWINPVNDAVMYGFLRSMPMRNPTPRPSGLVFPGSRFHASLLADDDRHARHLGRRAQRWHLPGERRFRRQRLRRVLDGRSTVFHGRRLRLLVDGNRARDW